MIDKLKKLTAKGTAGRDVTVLTIGTVLAQGISIAAMPLLARMYTPSEFGLLGVLVAISSIVALIVTLRYETAILIPEKNNEAATITLLSVGLIVATTIFITIIYYLLSDFIVQWIKIEGVHSWMPMAILVGGAMAFTVTLQGWMNRNKKYIKIAILRVFQSLAIVAMSFAYVYSPEKKDGLLWAQVFGIVISCIVATWMCRKVINEWNPSELKNCAQKYSNAPKYLLVSDILDEVTLYLPIIMIAIWFGEAFAGQFGMAWKLLMLPISLVGMAVGQVFMQRMSLIISDQVNSKQLLIKTWKILFFMGILPVLVILGYGDNIFVIVLGEEWSDAGIMASVIAPMALAIFVSSPTSGLYILLGLQKLSLFFGIASLIFRPLCLYVGYYFNDITKGLIAWCCYEILAILIYQYIGYKKVCMKRLEMV
jgi:O-antigen/teichoic acid export membrane protein